MLNRGGETVLLPAGCAAGGVVAIDNNSDSTIHVLDHCGRVTVDDCDGCEVVVGPCESCFVRDCKNCTLHIAAKQLRAKNCVDCSFYVHVESGPVIEASCDMKFGAWHLVYPEMEAQFSAAGLGKSNRWDAVVNSSDDGDAGANWSTLPHVPQGRQLGGGGGDGAKVHDATPAPASAAEPAAAAEPTPQYFRVVFQGVVSVRDGPRRDAAEVGERLPGDIVEASRVQDGWAKLVPPAGFKGGERWMLIEADGTPLLDPLPLSRVPLSARGGNPSTAGKGGEALEDNHAEATSSDVACCSTAAMVVLMLLGLLLGVPLAQHLSDGAIRTVWPAPAFSVADIPDQGGKRVLITGATGGLGKVMAIELAKKGAHVLVGSRTSAKGVEAAAEIVAASGAEPRFVEPITIDLASLASVQAAADIVNNAEAPLHTLILNAGVMAPAFSLTADGYETQFGVNHLGHFALATALMGKLKDSAPSRIVTISSKAHLWTYDGGIRGLYTEHFHSSINDEESYDPWAAYGQSKLCNLLMSLELSRRLAGTQVYVNTAHPGFVATDLQRHNSALLAIPTSLLAMGPIDGALTPLFLSTSPRVATEDIRGQYYTPIAQPGEASGLATDTAMALKLWQQSEQLVAAILKQDEPDKFFMGKKSTASAKDGRRLKAPPTAEQIADATDSTSQGCSVDGGGESECGAPDAEAGGSNEESSPPSAPASTYVRPKSKIIIGPGGAKWEIFRE